MPSAEELEQAARITAKLKAAQSALSSLPGADLEGYMPLRQEMDVVHNNDAENILADMEFSATDAAEDRELKLKVLHIYNKKLDEREFRKKFVTERGLLDWRKVLAEERRQPEALVRGSPTLGKGGCFAAASC